MPGMVCNHVLSRDDPLLLCPPQDQQPRVQQSELLLAKADSTPDITGMVLNDTHLDAPINGYRTY